MTMKIARAILVTLLVCFTFSGLIVSRAHGEELLPPDTILIEGLQIQESNGIWDLKKNPDGSIYYESPDGLWQYYQLENGKWQITSPSSEISSSFTSKKSYPAGTVPEKASFESWDEEKYLPRMSQTSPPTNISVAWQTVIGGETDMSLVYFSSGQHGWYNHNAQLMLEYHLSQDDSSPAKSAETETCWRLKRQNTGEILCYNPSTADVPPNTGWLAPDGSAATGFVFHGQATGYVSHITQGEADWTDYLELDNLSGRDAYYTIYFYPEGASGSVTGEVEGGKSALVDIKALAPSATCARIVAPESMKMRAGYRNNGSGGVAEFYLNDDVGQHMGYFFTQFNDAATWKGLSIMNTGSVDATVMLFAYGETGQIGTATITVAAGTRTVGVTGTWFPGLDIKEIDRILVGADQDIAGIVITGNADSSQITFTQAAKVN